MFLPKSRLIRKSHSFSQVDMDKKIKALRQVRDLFTQVAKELDNMAKELEAEENDSTYDVKIDRYIGTVIGRGPIEQFQREISHKSKEEIIAIIRKSLNF